MTRTDFFLALKFSFFLVGFALLSLLVSLHAAQPTPLPPEYTNHLAGQKSPYLLQHEHNPVDWYPWGDEAFAKSKRENKPIFLSIGYSTCHWCHVMERESFENPVIAKLLNDSFVAIKVDREERPDVDSTYMTFVQATTGSGGWPMNVFVTPDLQPFVGGTYFPPEDRDGMPGLKSILPQIAKAWKDHRAEIVTQASEITGKLQAMTTMSLAAPSAGDKDKANTPLDVEMLDAGLKALAARYDSTHGGFGDSGPKFPQPVDLNFLSRMASRDGTDSPSGKQALDMDLGTLRAMAAGGIHDHLGGGFHRYSTDPAWHVPHFEKMLYDQAQLANAYLDAYQLTGDTKLADVARDILGYVSRDLRDPATGAFFSAEDADSQPSADQPDRVEGAFYVWKKTDIDTTLGPDEAPLFDAAYHVQPDGNVPPASDARGELQSKNVLDATGDDPVALAAKFHLSTEEIAAHLATDRAKLLARRNERPRPRRDDKTITAWNGLAISAFARAAQVLGAPTYLETARRAASFLQTHLYDSKTSELLRFFRDGPGPSAGFSDDYAFLIQGLLDLYSADFDTTHLAWARELQQTQDRLFLDDKAGGYFASAPGQDPHVFLRAKNGEDNAEPSANAVAALNDARLGQMFEDDAALHRSHDAVAAFASLLHQAPLAAPQMLVALDFQLGPVRQIVVAGQTGSPDTDAMLRAINRLFLPKALVILADGGTDQAFLTALVPSLKAMHPLDGGKAAAYVCQNFACQQPTTSISAMITLLERRFPHPPVPAGTP